MDRGLVSFFTRPCDLRDSGKVQIELRAIGGKGGEEKIRFEAVMGGEKFLFLESGYEKWVPDLLLTGAIFGVQS